MTKTDEAAQQVKKSNRSSKRMPLCVFFAFFVYCPLRKYLDGTDIVTSWKEIGLTFFVVYLIGWIFDWDM